MILFPPARCKSTHHHTWVGERGGSCLWLFGCWIYLFLECYGDSCRKM